MKTVQLGIGNQFSSSVTDPVIAINDQNNVLCIACSSTNSLYYYVGTVNGMVIDWHSQQKLDDGAHPSVALNNLNQYVEVHRTSNIFGSSLWWSTGTLDAASGTLTTHSAISEGSLWGSYSPSIALSNASVIAGAYQSNSSTITCKMGKIQGDAISFSSTDSFTGTHPSIAFNTGGGLIVVYFNSDTVLCYRLGQLQNNNTTVSWEAEQTVGQSPLGTSSMNVLVKLSVAYTSDAIIIVYPNGNDLTSITANWTPGTITWGEPAPFDEGITPSVSANDSLAVSVHKSENFSDIYYTVSLIADHANWMGNQLNIIGSKTLGQIVMPATHDAGMWDSGTLPQARCQDQSIRGQLQGGVRYFDLRPKYSSGSFSTYHGPSTGESLNDVLSDVLAFMTSDQRNELVILKFSHFKDFSDSVYSTFVSEVTASLSDFLLSYDASTKLGTLTMNQMVSTGGRVLVVCDEDYAISNPQMGIYVYRDGSLQCPTEDRSDDPTQGNLVVWDCYSNSTTTSTMTADQLNKLASYTGYCDGNYTSTPCDLFLLSWTLTPWTNSVWNDSINPARELGPQMNPIAANQHGKIPNLLYVNYYEYTRATDIAILMNRGLPMGS